MINITTYCFRCGLRGSGRTKENLCPECDRSTGYTWEEVEQEFGKSIAKKMKKSQWLNGITVKCLPNGDVEYPSSDIMRAYRDIRGELSGEEEWD